jgi:NitT/TauT family transport system ATP-binding protein
MKLLKANNISKTFINNGSDNKILADLNFELKDGEIVAILGKSGSGKSTFLRILAGLIQPSSGEILYRDNAVTEPVKGIGMVFQNFALMPWLTVLENVELGLEALGINREERRTRAIDAIDMIGLDGFESAYPKELSGGMKQRVGFARALVMNPDILIMDEPFSALDVLTAENLKTDLLELWQNKKTGTNGILFVTHNIEEALMLSNKIVIMSSNPGKIAGSVDVNLPYPRNYQDPEFLRLVDVIYTLITANITHNKKKSSLIKSNLGLGYRIPEVSTDEIMGLIETIYTDFESEKTIDLPKLSDHLAMDIDDLLPITEALETLELANVFDGDIKISETGVKFFNADLLERKKIFAKQLLKNIPLARAIRNRLDEASFSQISEKHCLELITPYLSAKESQKVMRTMIDWGRYAEIFAYNFNENMLTLENPN